MICSVCHKDSVIIEPAARPYPARYRCLNLNCGWISTRAPGVKARDNLVVRSGSHKPGNGGSTPPPATIPVCVPRTVRKEDEVEKQNNDHNALDDAVKHFQTIKMKRCPRCQGMKPLNDFYRDAARADGRKCACKECEGKGKVNHRVKSNPVPSVTADQLFRQLIREAIAPIEKALLDVKERFGL